ncbi:alpha/beta fold hydrolase [Desertibaculum subflavum]|uniref:alpha/beta fold hydrolase n=1 Tax=Desertibaculum subflavum TaxID=2268458 RepID=UPI000E6668E8
MARKHHQLDVNGISMHVVEEGEGPLVLLCHGWPESWYSWRHQLTALAAAGFRAVAPDMRGYGKTTAPASIDDYTMLHHAGDLVGLVKALGAETAAIVGHDWGAPAAWNTALMRPDMFRAVAGLSVPYSPRGAISLTDMLKKQGLHRFYIMYFQQPGVAEAEFERDPKATLRRVLYSASGSPPESFQWNATVPEGGGLLDTTIEPDVLPEWLTEADLDFYAGEFSRAGFRGGLNWYRAVHRSWQLLAPWAGASIRQPSFFIAGTRDGVIRGPAGKAALEKLEQSLPGLRGKLLIEGAGHWIQQERPAEVNEALIGFLKGCDLR